MDNVHKLRTGNGHFTSNNPGVIGNRSGNLANGHGVPRSQMYINQPTVMPRSSHDELEDLTRNLRGINLQAPGFGNGQHQPSNQMSAQSSVAGGVSLGGAMPYLYNGQITFGQPYYAQPTGPMVNNGAYNGYLAGQYGDSPPSWNSSRVTSGQMPSLVTPRRSSGGSSNEHADLPGTPFTQYSGYGGGVPIFDNSPGSVYSWSTPSPARFSFNNVKSQKAEIPVDLQVACQRSPAIPKAVPAPYSPVKPLDRRLENPNGITNVYIRGLQPDTTDEMLYDLAVRFGEIESSKAIIDMSTGLCKGFGFVKYFNFQDAENCIRGFHFCGYETSFARESFYSQLKKLADTTAANLYISNLPVEYNEHDLGVIFEGYEVCSKRILRNPDGSGRGVGFARFASHDMCEKVIRDFNNMPITKPNGEKYNIQIRYADTPEQKALKQQTTAARQYRSAEYESQTTQNPNAFLARFPDNNGFGPYMSGVNAHYHSNGYDTGASVSRLSVVNESFSPSSAHTAINVGATVKNGYTNAAHAGVVDDEDQTINAPIAPSTMNESKSSVETGVSD